jgi:hypothetical protein
MPPNHGIRSNDGERAAGLRKQAAGQTQNHPVDGQKWHPTGPTSSQHDDLLPQHQDLGFQRRARSEQIDDNPKNYYAEIQHSQKIIRFCVSRQLDEIYDRDRLPDDYDVRDSHGKVVGRIMLHSQAPKDQPRFWTITAREIPPSVHNHGYSATREQAMADFKARWLATIIWNSIMVALVGRCLSIRLSLPTN